MNSKEIIEELKSESSEKYKANVVKMGIPEEYSIGVSTTIVRSIAKKIGKSTELGFELWNTGYHEARLLAVLLFDRKDITHSDIKRLMSDVISWDLCDHLCKNLIIKMKDYQDFIFEWITSPHVYEKRASFTLIASSAIHDKKLSNDVLDTYLKLVRENSDSEHEHIKKAVSWALREIGKIDFSYNEKALLLAHDLKENGNKVQVWIAKDAMKELENVVKVEGRTRLISTKTKMGSTIS
ncbi:DNA alkylation repair protein [Roseburia sp. 499]|uniref:DNA alkylation repair protein n=1 Tax=Roseburia sp. 499 TaxID=1261634 RepID=UPI000952B234|nr:DNA alkylation repair protein [Roseburia sp. 499]WVK71164.1 DNA alkylation repair protein [Roseburia sp. 499]